MTTDTTPLSLLVADAKRRYDALAPVDKAIADTRQRQSFVRGMMSEGSLPPRFDDAASVLVDEVERLVAENAHLRTEMLRSLPLFDGDEWKAKDVIATALGLSV